MTSADGLNITPDSRLAPALKWGRARFSSRERFVYVVECQGRIKVGIATKLAQRLSALQTGCPLDITLLATWRTIHPFECERAIHRMLDPYWIRGEWFHPPPAMIVRLLTEANSYPGAQVTKAGREFLEG